MAATVAVATPCCPAARLGDDAGLAHPAGQEDLAQGVVDLVGAGCGAGLPASVDLAPATGVRGARVIEGVGARRTRASSNRARAGMPGPPGPGNIPPPAPATGASTSPERTGLHRVRNGPVCRPGHPACACLGCHGFGSAALLPDLFLSCLQLRRQGLALMDQLSLELFQCSRIAPS